MSYGKCLFISIFVENFKKFRESIKIVKINTSDIMNILEQVLKYHTNMDTKAPIDGRSSGADAAFQRDQSKILKRLVSTDVDNEEKLRL